MATLNQQPYVIARLVDASTSHAEIRIHVQRTTSRAAGLAAARQLATLCDGASSCTAVSTVLRYPIIVTPEGNPTPGANGKRVGVLIFETADAEQFGIIEIPGISAALRDPTDERLLLLTAPPLQAYINTLKNGAYCNPFGYILTKCIAGLFEYRQN